MLFKFYSNFFFFFVSKMFVWDGNFCKQSCCYNKCSGIIAFPFLCTLTFPVGGKKSNSGLSCIPPALYSRIQHDDDASNDGCIVNPCYCEVWRNYHSSDYDKEIHICPYRCCFFRDSDYHIIMNQRHQNNDKNASSCSPYHCLHSTVSKRNTYTTPTTDCDDLETRYLREIKQPRYTVTERDERIAFCCWCERKDTLTHMSTIELRPPEHVRMDMNSEIHDILVVHANVPDVIAKSIMTFV